MDEYRPRSVAVSRSVQLARAASLPVGLTVLVDDGRLCDAQRAMGSASDPASRKPLQLWSSALLAVCAVLGVAYVVAGMVDGAPRTFDRGTSSVKSVVLQEALGGVTVLCLLVTLVFAVRRLPKAITMFSAGVVMGVIWLVAFLSERAS